LLVARRGKHATRVDFLTNGGKSLGPARWREVGFQRTETKQNDGKNQQQTGVGCVEGEKFH